MLTSKYKTKINNIAKFSKIILTQATKHKRVFIYILMKAFIIQVNILHKTHSKD